MMVDSCLSERRITHAFFAQNGAQFQHSTAAINLFHKFQPERIQYLTIYRWLMFSASDRYKVHMDFPITTLMDREACLARIREYLHPNGLNCPHCQAPFEQARQFRRTKRSELDVYRGQNCRGIYNLYSGPVFEGRYFRPEKSCCGSRNRRNVPEGG
jgi:hypothetical protein